MMAAVSTSACKTDPLTGTTHKHNALGKLGVVSLLVPVAALVCAARTPSQFDVAFFCIFGALGFSLSAVMMWLRANYLAANYLEERRIRRTNYVQALAKPSASATEGNGSARPRAEPRTIARLDPVFPAFLCVFAVFGAGACIIGATLKVVWDVRETMTSS